MSAPESVAVLRLSICYPPTSNHNTMAVRGRRILSPKYRDWRAKAEAEIQREASGLAVLGPYSIRYTAERPDRRRRDVENLPKSISDALQASGVIRDDADCQCSTVEWAHAAPRREARVWVTITSTKRAAE